MNSQIQGRRQSVRDGVAKAKLSQVEKKDLLSKRIQQLIDHSEGDGGLPDPTGTVDCHEAMLLQKLTDGFRVFHTIDHRSDAVRGPKSARSAECRRGRTEGQVEPGYGMGEAVASPRDIYYVPPLTRGIPQSLPQRGHVRSQAALVDSHTLPDLRQDLLFGDHIAGVPHQVKKYVEGPTPNGNRLAFPKQKPLRLEQSKRPELNDLVFRRHRRFHLTCCGLERSLEANVASASCHLEVSLNVLPRNMPSIEDGQMSVCKQLFAD
jgi:hypothetical protein